MSGLDPQARLSDLAQRYWRFRCEEFPHEAIQAGESTPDAVVFRESSADYDRRRAAAGRMLAELAVLEDAALEGQDWATCRLLVAELEEIVRLHEVEDHLRPGLLPLGPDFWATHFANTSSIVDGPSAERYVERLATLPAFLRDTEARLLEGLARGWRYPRVVTDAAVAIVRGSLTVPVAESPWTGPFRRSGATDKSALERCGRQAEALVRDELLPALQSYADTLAGPLAQAARSTLACTDAPLGREFYLAQVRKHTTTSLSPDEIHELGLAEVARLEAEAERFAAAAGFAGDPAGYRQFLATDRQFYAPTATTLREQVEVIGKRIDKKLPAYFGTLPRSTWGVEMMSPAQSANLPVAYAQPNPADGSGPGLFWLTALPERCGTYTLVSLVLHEAWPGHLMHIALMQEMAGLPSFRRHAALRYTACLEGWALYCESLGVEMGLYETPHQHYGRLEMEMFRALRLVVDTGVHWKGWSREQAVDCMVTRLAMPRATIESEVNRYVGLPGQALAYQVGNLELRGLRQRAQARLGSRFDLRAFHDELMGAGPASLPVMKGLVERWAALRERARPAS